MEHPDADRDLAEYLSEPVLVSDPDDDEAVIEAPPDHEGFDPERHFIAMRIIDADVAALTDAATEQQMRVAAWLDDRTAGPIRERKRHEALLEQWLAGQLAADPAGPKSRTLANGRIESHQTGGRVQVTDPDALRRFAHDEIPLAHGAWTMPQVIALPLELVQALVGYAIDARRPDSSAEFMDATRDAVKAAEQAIIDQGKVAANVVAKAAKWIAETKDLETGEVAPGRYTYHGKTVPGLTKSDEGRNYKVEVEA